MENRNDSLGTAMRHIDGKGSMQMARAYTDVSPCLKARGDKGGKQNGYNVRVPKELLYSSGLSGSCKMHKNASTAEVSL
jgi:hypothetical protein